MAQNKRKISTRARTEGIKLICKHCGKEKAMAQNFYKSSRPEYEETGYCNVCKTCIQDLLINPNTGMVDRKNFKDDVCKMLDIPFVPHEYANLVKKPNITMTNFVGEYRKILNVRKEYKGLTYEDSVKFENDENGFLAAKRDYAAQVTEEMIEFWGVGFSAEYYIDVQKRYDSFMEYEDLDKLDFKKQSDYKTLCQLERVKTEMLQSKDMKPSDLKSIVESISKLSADLNIKAIQKKEDESATGHYIIGLVTKYIENVRQTPIPKLQDIDWLGDMTKSEFDVEMAYMMSEILNEQNKPNKYQNIVDADKKKYSPSEEELEINRLEDSEEDDY